MRRRRRRRWWAWWWGWNIWCLLRMWGCKFFCFFRTRSRWGWNIFVYLPDVGMERVGIEKEEEEGGTSEEGTCTVLCELQGICAIACERDIHVGAPLMSIQHLLHSNLCP
jgi:hypothetical protein